MMGKKGQKTIVFLMVAVFVIILALAFSTPLKDQVVSTMNSSSLNCTSPNIPTVIKATCTTIDFGFFYFISIIIAISLAIVAGKRDVTGIISSIFVFVVVVAMISPLKNLIITFRDATHLNCASTTIVGVKLTCIFVDLWLFYFVVAAIASAVTLIFIKKVLK